MPVTVNFCSQWQAPTCKDYMSYSATLDKWLDGMEYNRKVDQALWTYGHLFNENKSNLARCEKQ